MSCSKLSAELQMAVKSAMIAQNVFEPLVYPFALLDVKGRNQIRRVRSLVSTFCLIENSMAKLTARACLSTALTHGDLGIST